MARLLLWPLSLCLPFTVAGCGQTACFVWSPNEGACPAQDKALTFFSDPNCPGTVISVDSDGQFGNDLCCYAVTKDDTGINSDVVPCGTIGKGGAGGSFGTGPGTGTATAVTVGSSGVGGGPAGCTHCQAALSQNGLFSAGLCPSSQMLLNTLANCVCTGPCVSACQGNFCTGGTMPSQACLSCLTDTANGCGGPFTTCANDV